MTYKELLNRLLELNETELNSPVEIWMSKPAIGWCGICWTGVKIFLDDIARFRSID